MDGNIVDNSVQHKQNLSEGYLSQYEFVAFRKSDIDTIHDFLAEVCRGGDCSDKVWENFGKIYFIINGERKSVPKLGIHVKLQG